ncbi:MAG: hypothetical protein LBC98_10300 [Prevotellaceae bacterium]|nr:hypothetical protein [Prevotellaceae bacterium]
MKKMLFLLVVPVFYAAQMSAQEGGTEPERVGVAPRQISEGQKTEPNPKPVENPVQEKTDQIAKKLDLDDEKKKAIYNVVSQADKRINDLAIGTDNYAKLIGYIHGERSDMLKAALTKEQYFEYQKSFGSKDVSEINKLISKNEAFVKKRDAAAAKEKREAETLMAKEKAKQAAAEKKAKEQEKKAAAKKAAAEKKAADKLKQQEKQLKDKQKAAEKKEADRQKAAEKKAKEQEKKAAARLKELEKKSKK